MEVSKCRLLPYRRNTRSVFAHEGRIELVPERDIRKLRGFLKGINTRLDREEDRV